MKAALPCEYTDGQTDIRTPEVICNDFFENSTSNSFPLKVPSIKQPVCRIQINGQSTGWTTHCDDRSFYSSSWYCYWFTDFCYSLLTHLIAEHCSQFTWLWRKHAVSGTFRPQLPISVTQRDEAGRRTFTNQTHPLNNGNKIPHCILSTSCWDFLHTGSAMCHVLWRASHCILHIPVRYPRHSSHMKEWMGSRNKILLITSL